MTKIKLSILGLLAFFLSASFFISCSKEENINKSEKDLNSKLLIDLSTFNQTNSSSNPLSERRRCSGFWGCLGYASQVAGADIIGAATGVVGVSQSAAALGIATGGTGAVVVMAAAGVICGGGASYAAARTYDPNYIKDTLEYGHLNINVPHEYLAFSNVGIDHNTVIHNNFFNNISIENYYNNNFDTKQIELLKSTYMNTAIEKVNTASVDYVKNNFDYKTFTQRMLTEKYFTVDMKAVMDLFLEKYFTCQQDLEFQETINYYITAVSESDLTKLEKQALIASFMVASESPFYFYSEE